MRGLFGSEMNFLAFDIEAANGYKPYSICSVGYVVADESFNILHKENIWINPKTKYNLNGTRKNVGIDLHLDKKVIDSAPTFRQAYDRLEKLLSDPTVRVVGHAVESDVSMLNSACRHYKLPCINFEFICSQLLFKLYRGDKDVRGLDKIADELGIRFEHHASDEDALASMLTLKYLCEDSKLSVDELLEKFNVRRGLNKNFVVTRTVSLSGQISKKHLTAEAIKAISEYIRVNRLRSAPKGALKGKLVSLSRALECSGGDALHGVLRHIYASGGQYTAKVSKGSVYVRTEGEQSETDLMREGYLSKLIEDGFDCKIMTVNEFLEN